MAIVMLVSPSRGEDVAHDVPVAPFQTFREVWLPACKALGLKWVPMFETGIPIDVDDVPDVRAELRSLKAWLAQPGNHDAASVMGERVDNLIEGLEEASRNPTAHIFVG
jgi:hypothetical protein